MSDETPVIEKIQDWLGPDGCDRDLTRRDWRQYIFLRNGSGLIDLVGDVSALKPGALMVIPSGAVCRIQLKPGAHGILMGASEAFLRSRVLPALFVPAAQYWRSYSIPQITYPWAGPEHRKLRDTVQRELENAGEKLGAHCDAAVIAYAFVILSVHRPQTPQQYIEPPKLEPGQMEPAQLVLRFRELVEQNFRNHLGIAEYCELLGVTPVRLARACKSTVNRAPLSLIHERIVLEARSELVYTSKTISEIGYGLGFEDAAYFSRFFKQHTGDAPLDLRRANMTGTDRKAWKR